MRAGLSGQVRCRVLRWGAPVGDVPNEKDLAMDELASQKTRKRIVVVSSQDRDARFVVERLAAAGYELVDCADADSACEVAARSDPDLILLDIGLDAVREHRVLEALADDRRTLAVPILLLTKRSDPSQDGALSRWPSVDWMKRPFGSAELLSRVRAVLRVARSDVRAGPGCSRDALTRLYNREYFEARLVKEVDRARRYARSVACVMIDVDGLRSINSRYGHDVGDEVLRLLADILLSQTRTPDVVARYGGEEFALLLPETSASDAGVLAERIRAAFCERGARCEEGDVVATVSCGVAVYPDHANDQATLVRMADSALYDAKREGRNRTEIAFADVGEPTSAEGLQGATILLVEDNDLSRSVASVVLRASGYRVIEAVDGVTALALARASHPDLVLMDVQLAGLGGLEVTKRLVEMEETRDIPIVVLTASDLPKDLEDIVGAGCRGYITKPIDTANLATEIEGFLRQATR